MAATVIIEGDSDIATRDRVFDCPYCGEKFIGHSTDTGFELATPAEMNDLGITAKMTCPECNNTAVSSMGSAGEVPEITGIAVKTLPAKTWYKPGDKFDPTGLEIVALWSNGAMTDVALTDCTFSPDTDTALALTDKKVTVTHTASSKTVDVALRVTNSQVRKPIPQATSYVYTGEAISLQVTGFDSETMTRSNYSKTAAGSYEASYTPKTGYCWEDGTTDAYKIAWVIEKATPAAPTLSKSELKLTAIATPGTFTVTRTGNGTVSAVSSDTEVCTVSVSGTTVTVTAVADGEATVTVSVAEGTNYKAPAEKPVCTVEVELV